MKYLVLILSMTIAVACSLQTYEDEDVVAVVKGKEITVKDIRSLYFVEDEELPNMVVDFVKEEILVLEAQKKGLDVTEEVESMDLMLPLDATENEDFLKKQADYLGITVEQYYEVYFRERFKRDAYVNKLINEVLDLSKYEADEYKAADEEINEYIDNLLNEYKEDIEILLK